MAKIPVDITPHEVAGAGVAQIDLHAGHRVEPGKIRIGADLLELLLQRVRHFHNLSISLRFGEDDARCRSGAPHIWHAQCYRKGCSLTTSVAEQSSASTIQQ